MGQAHDGKNAEGMLDQMQPGQILLADRAYDSDAMRQRLAERGAWANVKPMPNRKNVPAFNAFLYKYRNLVERFFNKLKYFREGRHTIRQAGRQLSRQRQARFTPHLAAL